MGKTTEIQWCDSTVNPTTGCGGCELWTPNGRKTCYAGIMHEGRMAKALPGLYDPDFTRIRLAPGRMIKAAAWSDLTGTDRPDKPWLNGLPRTIFVGDMGDILSRDITYEYIEREVIANATSPKGRRHVWMLLTKRAARLSTLVTTYGTEAGSWPKNVWVGTSVTDQKTVDSRIPYLCETPNATRFVSAEPLYGPIAFDPKHLAMIDMIIVGGESGGRDANSFDVNWVREISKQVEGMNCKLFVKQLGSYPYIGSCYGGSQAFMTLRDGHGGDWNEWPEDVRRREFPREAACSDT